MSDDENVLNYEGNDVDEYKAKLAEYGDKLVVVDFFAEWCGPCRMMMPKVHKMAEDFGDEVAFIKVDVDENEDIAESEGVQAMPTFKLYKKGEQIETMSGANADKLQKLVEDNK
jgi:thioredoxin 1